MLEKLKQIQSRFLEVEKKLSSADAMSDMKLFVRNNQEYKDLNKNWVEPYLQEEETYDVELSQIYDKAFEVYKSGYESMKDFWNKNHYLQENKS